MRVLAAVAMTLVATCSGSPSPVTIPVTPSPAEGVHRYVVGGDSRDDHDHVIPWALAEAKARGATAVLFLGDMALTPELDSRFAKELTRLDPIPFYPLLGNHEVEQLGLLRIDQSGMERRFRARFLDTPRTPVASALANKVVYSVDLPGGLHYVALDNVSQHGFGRDQLDWLAHDLTAADANPGVRYVVVGMHKPLAGNGVTTHSMDADGDAGVRDSAEALTLFRDHHVGVLFESHDHRYATFLQDGILTYVTGGLGAPLDGHDAFHHFLQMDVSDDGLFVSVVQFSAATASN
jgi:hypothetical protein